MICENCKQRPASVTITQNRNGHQITKHFCDVCSQQVKVDSNEQLSMQQLFADWFGIPTWSTNAPKNHHTEPEMITCEGCGMSYNQFLQEGKFNCPTCYETFREQLPQIMKRLHNGATKHIGKVPGAVNEMYQLKQQIEQVRNDMKKAVEEEQFEKAAILRDEAKALERQLLGGDVHGE